jgi:hypothetical protein
MWGWEVCGHDALLVLRLILTKRTCFSQNVVHYVMMKRHVTISRLRV